MRRERLDHLLILSERHLHRVRKEYVTYLNYPAPSERRPMTTTLEQLYDFLTEDEAREPAPQEMPEGAAEHAPRNFFLNAANGAATKLGDKLVSPGLVLPWLLAAAGAPAALTGLLVPLRRATALLPQLAIAARMERSARRKWFWVAGAMAFGVAFLLMVPAALIPNPVVAGWVVIGLLVAGSLGRGVSSVAFKDVLGKTIPPGRRGTLLALRSTLGGLLALAAGVTLRLALSDISALGPYLWIMGIGAGLWVLGGLIVTMVYEIPSEPGEARSMLHEARAGWVHLRQEVGFRRFVITRIFLLTITLSIPYFSLYGRDLTGAQVGNLGVFVIAIALAEIISSPVWGRFADRSSQSVMLVGSGLAALAGGLAVAFPLAPEGWQTATLFGVIILLLGFGRAGVRLGRKTYLVDGAPVDERPLYAAISNTVLGIFTLAGSAFGLVQDWIGTRALVAVFAGLALVGALLAWRLPEAEHMVQ